MTTSVSGSLNLVRLGLNGCSHTLLVKPLPAGCRLTAIFDSCHSGTVMDLPYTVCLAYHVSIESLADNQLVLYPWEDQRTQPLRRGLPRLARRWSKVHPW